MCCRAERFLTWTKLPAVSLQDNYPDMDVTCMEASPFYLAKARDNMKYWRRLRAPDSQKGDVDTFIQGLAEDIPALDDTFDVVCAGAAVPCAIALLLLSADEFSVQGAVYETESVVKQHEACIMCITLWLDKRR